MKKNLLPLFFAVLIAAPISFAQTSEAPAGTGTSGDSYQIATLNNLYWIADQVNTGTDFTGVYFKQTSDIDASSTSGWPGGGWNPIGNTFMTYDFEGNYDGQKYVVIGLYVNRGSTQYGGLFGILNGATIQNLGVKNANITGNYRSGALAGHAMGYATISNCWSSGSVTGNDQCTGGLIGDVNQSTVTYCYSTASVTGTNSNTGGLIGRNQTSSSVSNCYASGSVNGVTFIGGFCGSNYSGSTINKCYSTGPVGTGSGFCDHDEGTVTSSFWDTQTSGQSSSTVGTGKTTAEMKTQATFTTNAWDFTTVWQMISGNYPDLLNNSNPALPVELVSFTATTNMMSAEIHWSTVTEVNNYGFEVERRTIGSSAWTKVGFVAGNGTSNTAHRYCYRDNTVLSGTYVYRLKQIDNNGIYKYSGEAEVEIGLPKCFAINQNFPNPFNPSTVISYTLPTSGYISLKVYDALGREVATLVNEVKEAGYYSATFDAVNLSSGIYFAKLQTGDKLQLKKMILLK